MPHGNLLKTWILGDEENDQIDDLIFGFWKEYAPRVDMKT